MKRNGKILVNVLLATIFVSFKVDFKTHLDLGHENDREYHRNEIGWTMKIPQGWDTVDTQIIKNRSEKGLKAMSEIGCIPYDDIKLMRLLNFQKDRGNSFMSTCKPYEISYAGPWASHLADVKKLIYDSYITSGTRVDTFSSTEEIAELEFQVFHLELYGPDGKVILYQDRYGRYINRYDFRVNLNYTHGKWKEEMIEVWKNSRFE